MKRRSGHRRQSRWSRPFDGSAVQGGGAFTALLVVAVLVLPAIGEGAAAPQAQPDAVREWVETLARGKETSARLDAAQRLGLSKDPRALGPLVKALEDENRAVRWAAVEALGDLGDKRAVPALLAYLKKREAYGWARRLLANALGAIGDATALPPVAELLKSDDPYLRRNAAVALGKMKDPRAIPPLIELQKDEIEWVRRSAQAVLVQLAGPRLGPETPRDHQAWARWYAERGDGTEPRRSGLPPAKW